MLKTQLIEKTFEKLSKKLGLSRYCYYILVESGRGQEAIERFGEPCYGGLRKYKDTHPDATLNEDKPGDLYHPFPQGTPLGVMFIWRGNLTKNPLFNYLVSNDSPWKKGFSSHEELIIRVMEIANGSKVTAMVVTNSDVDPTVMVHLAKIIKTSIEMFDVTYKFEALLKEGATNFEALLGSVYLAANTWTGGFTASTYTFPSNLNVKNMFYQKPNDLTGGTFKNRFDYNRKKFADLFSGRDEYGGGGVLFAEEMGKAMNTKTTPPELFYKTLAAALKTKVAEYVA